MPRPVQRVARALGKPSAAFSSVSARQNSNYNHNSNNYNRSSGYPNNNSNYKSYGSNYNSNYNNHNRQRPSSSGDLLSLGTAKDGDAALRLLDRLSPLEMHKRRAEASTQARMESLEVLRNVKNSNDYLKQMPRRWDAGDVYSPHDMSPVEMQKWRKRSPRKADIVDALGISPLDMYKNFSLVQEFTSSSGQITHSSGTSLRPVNQRKIAKMIRRVQGMGLYPTIHSHPEMIRDDFFPKGRS